ncbi:MAG: EamA family transporter [Rhizobiales bacterium]|nr:EamA family transporter [Hyphomicrobiales bacterium]
MAGTLASFALLAVAGREVMREVDVIVVMLLRSIIGVALVASIALLVDGGFGRLVTRRPGLQLARNVVHFIGQYCWFVALTLIPLAQLFAIEFTAPLWVALLAPLLLGERFSRTRLLAALVGFAGVLLVIRPGAVPVSTGSLVMLVGAVAFALSILSVKRLLVTDDPLAILFYMSLLQIPMALVPASFVFVWPNLEQFGWIGLISLTALSAHFCMARAMRVADAAFVAPMDFLRLPIIAVVGALLYGEAFDPWVIAGGAVIFAANLMNIFTERRRRSRANA